MSKYKCDHNYSCPECRKLIPRKTKAEEKLITEALIAHAALVLSTWGNKWNPSFNKAAIAVLKERKKK